MLPRNGSIVAPHSGECTALVGEPASSTEVARGERPTSAPCANDKAPATPRRRARAGRCSRERCPRIGASGSGRFEQGRPVGRPSKLTINLVAAAPGAKLVQTNRRRDAERPARRPAQQALEAASVVVAGSQEEADASAGARRLQHLEARAALEAPRGHADIAVVGSPIIRVFEESGLSGLEADLRALVG